MVLCHRVAVLVGDGACVAGDEIRGNLLYLGPIEANLIVGVPPVDNAVLESVVDSHRETE